MLDKARCLGCGNEFRPHSRPHWAFGPDARLVGLVHASCPLPLKHHRIPKRSKQNRERVEFLAWCLWSGYRDDISRWTEMLWDQPTEALTAEQLGSLTRWVRQEKIDAGELLKIVADHTEMVRAYHGWKAEVR